MLRLMKHAKAYEVIFVGYSNTSKSYRVFNKSSHTIEESMHVKFEESNAIVENVVEIDSLGENMEKISLKDSRIQEDKQEPIGEVQKDEVEQSQPHPKNWRYATNHPKDLILANAGWDIHMSSQVRKETHKEIWT